MASPTSLPTTDVTLMQLKLCTRQLRPSCLKRLLLTQTLQPLILHVILRRRLPLNPLFAFVAYRVFFFLAFLSLFVSVLPLLLTWRARHSQPPVRYQASAFSEIS